MTRPSPTIAYLRQLLDRYILNVEAKKGEPAALGKSATAGSDVFYDDGTTVHTDRVWVRKGANLQILLVALIADGISVPDVANTRCRVMDLFGMPYVVAVEPAAAAAEPTIQPSVVMPANMAIRTGSPTYDADGVSPVNLPLWILPDSSTTGIRGATIAKNSGNHVLFTVHYAASATGTARTSLRCWNVTEGDPSTSSWTEDGFSSPMDLVIGTANKHGIVEVDTNDWPGPGGGSFPMPVAAGDILIVEFERSGASVADVLAGNLFFIGAEVLIFQV